MGMFDSVYVDCPWCGSRNEVQSKQGVCDLKNYRLSVPVEIAHDISKHSEQCSSCKKWFKVVPGAATRVAVSTIQVEDYVYTNPSESDEDEIEYDDD